jgi:formylglycine-generating enzyme required for sulfatase activity
MKQTLTLLISLLMLQTLSAQHISIESFTKLENDMDARVHHPKRDQNGELSAIIKVVTTETGFAWDGGTLGIVDAVRKTGEYWLYIPRGAQRITISHDRLGVLRNYIYPIPLESATVYEMRLNTGRIETTFIPLELKSQWLLINVEPNTAMIYLDDIFESIGLLQKRLTPGTYTYRIENNLYHTEAGRITITPDEPKELTIKLRPNFGYIKVNSIPETGARVLIDGRYAGFVTNAISERLQSGDYLITLIKEQFQPSSKYISVKDSDTVTIEIEMSPNFATLEITLPSNATLFINNERQGIGNWSGRLNAGIYSIEARLEKYRPARQDLQLSAGDYIKLNLEPQLITGSLEVVSVPPQAIIHLNGKDYGKTPRTIKDLVIGEYVLTIYKPGYSTIEKIVTIDDGGITMVSEKLISGMKVNITSKPEGAELFIDNQTVGYTPHEAELSYGNHHIKLINETKIVNDVINIEQNGKTIFSFNVTEYPDPFEGQMIFVEGGSFDMGCTGEQASYCFDSEKPMHRVNIEDFFIGKFEVTQNQWREIMGSNPSSFKNCEDCPVENVSWNDIQQFILKLNQLTGKNYRLPSEAEWEFAARGGNKSNGYVYSGSNNIDEVAWHSNNSAKRTHPVGVKIPNELGLYDMSGNVLEWCRDWYQKYEGSERTNPQGPLSGSLRLLRGGNWFMIPRTCRTSYRNSGKPTTCDSGIGFRLALSQ